MSPKRWTMLSYTKDSVVPLEGEIILLRYPTSIIDFPYGPASALAVSANSSHMYSGFSNTTNPKRIRSALHHILITNIKHDKQNHKINITFFPIMSYSATPPGITDWNADQWMLQAADTHRLHHLPVPATGWAPNPPPSSWTPVLSFGDWVNTRCSWLAMVLVRHSFPEAQNWCRHPNGPVILDGGATAINELYGFLHNDIPVKLHEIHRTSDVTINTTTLPNYNPWADIYSYPYSIIPDDSSIEKDESITNSEIDRALAGEDGIDPISFWNFHGAPKELLERAQQQQRKLLDEKILGWKDCADDEGEDEGEDEDEDADRAVLDIEEVSFGEEAYTES